MAQAKKKDPRKTIIAGGIAGAIDCCVTMPLDTMGTQIQLQGYSGPVQCARAIVKANGVKGLYAGFVPFLMQSSAKSSIRFFSFELLSDLIGSAGFNQKHPAAALACGMGAGTLESLCLTAPTDRLKVLKQAMSAQSGGVPPTASQLIKERGLMTLYVGGLSTTLRQSSSVAVRFTCFGSIKRATCTAFGYQEDGAPVWVSFLAGGMGGALSVCLNNPIDVAKSKIQAGVHTSLVACIREVVREQGIWGLSAGLSARMPRLFVSQAIQFSIVDKIKQLL